MGDSTTYGSIDNASARANKAELEKRPGSDAARKDGCVCPRMDNHCGMGRGADGWEYGWYVRADCPVHGKEGGG